MNWKRPETKSRVLAAVILVMTLLYGLGNWHISRARQFATTTTFGKRAEGISVFFELIRSLGGNPTTQASPFFEKLSSEAELAILAPNSPITPREAKLFSEAVKSGGKLLVSLQDENDFRALVELHRALDWKLSIAEDKLFKNHATSSFSIDEGPLTASQETYTTYSRYYFSIGANDKSHFYLYKKWGKGEIHYFIGLTPFSNVLITEKDNAKLAVRLAQRMKSLKFDEYHHFFSDRTLWDLLKNPAFGVTIAGIVVTLFLFFLFGHTPLHERHLIPPPRKHAASFHEFGENFLRTTVGKKDQFEANVREHYQLLLRLYPEERTLIENEQAEHVKSWGNRPLHQQNYMQAISRVVQFQFSILKKKGRLLS